MLAKGLVERIGQAGNCPDYEAAISQCLGDLPIGLPELSAIGFKAVHAGPVTGARAGGRCGAGRDGGIHVPRAGAQSSLYCGDARVSASGSIGAAGRVVRNGVLRRIAGEHAYLFAFLMSGRKNSAFGVTDFTARAIARRVRVRRSCWRRKDIRHISCHLGGSSSIAAIRNGVAVDTSFGISPQSGIPHNNRTGDVDAFAALYAMKRLNLGVDEMASDFVLRNRDWPA